MKAYTDREGTKHKIKYLLKVMTVGGRYKNGQVRRTMGGI